MFRINAVVKKKNVRIACVELPNENKAVVMNIAGAENWCDIWKERVIWPYAFESDKVASEKYCIMLVYYAFLRFRLLQNTLFFSAAVLLCYIKTEYLSEIQLIWFTTIPTAGRGRETTCLFSMLSPPEYPCFLLVRSYQIKNMVYTHECHRRAKKWNRCWESVNQSQQFY